MKLWHLLTFAAALSGHVTYALSQTDPTTVDPKITPILLDPKDGTGVTLGLEYKLGGILYSHSDTTPAPITAPIVIDDFQLRYKATGTIASSAKRNPNNFLDFTLDAGLLHTATVGTFRGTGFLKYETDQSLDNKQAVIGVQGTYGKLGVVSANDFIALDVGYGRVDPKKDAERQAVLGNLDPFYRWNAEFLYMYPLKLGPFETLEYNYRYYKERNAPQAIAAAGLDAFKLSTIRVGLKNDLFIGYSTGRLPFDRKSDKTLQLGFSYKLK